MTFDPATSALSSARRPTAPGDTGDAVTPDTWMATLALGEGSVTSLAVRGCRPERARSSTGCASGGVRGRDFLWAEPLLAAGPSLLGILPAGGAAVCLTAGTVTSGGSGGNSRELQERARPAFRRRCKTGSWLLPERGRWSQIRDPGEGEVKRSPQRSGEGR